jgi:hypothetical protein
VVNPGELDKSLARKVCIHEDSTDFTVAWHSRGMLQEFRRFDPNGQPTSTRICTGLRGLPLISCGPRGSIAIGGYLFTGSSYSLFPAVRVFNKQNASIGTVLVEGTGSPAVALLGSGTLIATWSRCSEGAGCDIFAQRFAVSDEPDCAADCNSDGRVSIDELLTGVFVHLDQGVGGADGFDGSHCALLDTDHDCVVSVSELVTAVRQALHGCG